MSSLEQRADVSDDQNIQAYHTSGKHGVDQRAIDGQNYRKARGKVLKTDLMTIEAEDVLASRVFAEDMTENDQQEPDASEETGC